MGYTLAAHLLAENHDITVIDKDENVLNQTQNTLDVIGYLGNGAAYHTLVESGAAKADMLIAATASDEINMLCCLSAHKLGAKITVARVRNPEYYEQSNFLKSELGLSMVFNPERLAAAEIARILRFPSTADVEVFAGGRAEMVSCRVKPESPLEGVPLRDLAKKTGLNVLICAVERDGAVMIPSGDFVPCVNDKLYFTGSPTSVGAAFKKINLTASRARSVLIAGGSRIAYYLATELEKSGVEVKIIEVNPARAQELCRVLPKTSIIGGDAADYELLREEGIATVDAYISLTGLDEGNILSGLYAAEQGAKKVIVKVNNDNFVPLINGSSLETIISPKRIVANRILSYARAVSAGTVSGNIKSMYKFIDGNVEMLEFSAGADGSYLNVPLKDLAIQKGIIVACIIREGKVIIPGGNEKILANDSVLLVTAERKLQSLSDMVASR